MAESSREDDLRAVLTGESAGLTNFRNVLRRVPSSPRCRLCAAPFTGAGGAVLRHFGFARLSSNPAICSNCINDFRKHDITGTTIPVTMLFADIRGSTSIGERLEPAEFRAFLGRFYELASDAVLERDGLVDKLVGDEIVALFFGGVSGPNHSEHAIDAALDLAERCDRPDATPMGPIPVGTAVHTGDAWVGATGPPGAVDDFTALGDVVNTTARLASAAAAGEVLVSTIATAAAGRADDAGVRRTLDIRGRQEPVDVVVLRAAAQSVATA